MFLHQYLLFRNNFRPVLKVGGVQNLSLKQQRMSQHGASGGKMNSRWEFFYPVTMKDQQNKKHCSISLFQVLNVHILTFILVFCGWINILIIVVRLAPWLQPVWTQWALLQTS